MTRLRFIGTIDGLKYKPGPEQKNAAEKKAAAVAEKATDPGINQGG